MKPGSIANNPQRIRNSEKFHPAAGDGVERENGFPGERFPGGQIPDEQFPEWGSLNGDHFSAGEKWGVSSRQIGKIGKNSWQKYGLTQWKYGLTQLNSCRPYHMDQKCLCESETGSGLAAKFFFQIKLEILDCQRVQYRGSTLMRSLFPKRRPKCRLGFADW